VLVKGLEQAIQGAEVVDASSGEDARVAAEGAPFDVVMVCLDLPPAPRGGCRLADEMLEQGHAVVLITRSLRWLPPDAAALRALPWVTPEAGPAAVLEAIEAAIGARVPRSEETVPMRPSLSSQLEFNAS
jgi:hypothetical protein